ERTQIRQFAGPVQIGPCALRLIAETRPDAKANGNGIVQAKLPTLARAVRVGVALQLTNPCFFGIFLSRRSVPRAGMGELRQTGHARPPGTQSAEPLPVAVEGRAESLRRRDRDNSDML